MKILRLALTALFLLTALAEGKSLSDQPTFELNDALVAYASGADEKAVQLLPPFAEQEIAIAQWLLGRLYLYSPLIPRDCDAGVAMLVRSFANGNAEAGFDLGNLFRVGHCVRQSGSDAISALLQAHELGHTGAATALGELYLGGQDVEANHKVAAEWFQTGAAMFDTEACYQLGRLFSENSQLSRDYEEAYKWFGLASQFAPSFSEQHSRAVRARDRIREHLAPWQVQAASTEAHRELKLLVSRNRLRKTSERAELFPLDLVEVTASVR